MIDASEVVRFDYSVKRILLVNAGSGDVLEPLSVVMEMRDFTAKTIIILHGHLLTHGRVAGSHTLGKPSQVVVTQARSDYVLS